MVGVAPLVLLSQNTVEDDFEGNGTITTWFGDDCGMDTQFSNPFPNAQNPSATVLKYEDIGGQYANVRFDVAPNFDLSTHHTFTLKIYVPSSGITGNQPNQLSLKLQDGTLGTPWSTQCEIIKPLQLDQWQTLSFDFINDNYINLDAASPAPITRTDINRVLLQVNGENNNDEVIAYIDDLAYDGTLTSGGGGGGNPGDPVYDRLVWADEFDGQGAIDTSKWHPQTLLPLGNSWYNGEIQHYTDRIENAFLDSGYLHIMAINESYTDQGVTKDYTSARLNSKFAFTYGKVEVRAKLPFGVGTWPAIWMLGKNIDEPGGFFTDMFGTTPWPACGEIDIMEHWGSNQNYISSAIHTPSSFGSTINHGGVLGSDVSNTFHVYSCEWYPDRIEFRMNGSLFYTYEPVVQDMDTWPFDLEQYILLNVAILPTIAPSFTQSPMILDYVRVYQETPASVSETEEQWELSVFPNPSHGVVTLRSGEDFSETEISVVDLTGREVARFSGRAVNTFTFSLDLLSGWYFLQVQRPEGLITKSILLQ